MSYHIISHHMIGDIGGIGVIPYTSYHIISSSPPSFTANSPHTLSPLTQNYELRIVGKSHVAHRKLPMSRCVFVLQSTLSTARISLACVAALVLLPIPPPPSLAGVEGPGSCSHIHQVTYARQEHDIGRAPPPVVLSLVGSFDCACLLLCDCGLIAETL